MERSYSVKYRPASGGTQVPLKPEKQTFETYNKDTDNDIFALGDAVQDAGFNLSQFDIPDDIFKNFGFNPIEALRNASFPQNDTSSQVTYEVKRPPLRRDSDVSSPSKDEAGLPVGPYSLPTAPSPEQNNSGVQVATIAKTLPDGRRVQTRIIQGPVQRTARIIKINREMPSGETKLLATIKQPLTGPDAGKSTIEPAPGVDQAEVPIPPEFLDSLAVKPGQTDLPPKTTSAPLPPFPNSSPPMSPLPEGMVIRNTEAQMPPSPAPTFKANSFPTSPPRTPSRKESLKSRQSLSFRMSTLPEEDAIEAYHPEDEESGQLSELNLQQPRRFRPCPFKLPAFWQKRKGNRTRSPVNELMGKGKSGMAASEINADDKALPGLQALVANYARMLFEDRTQFVETLFRAVKLNKLDVARILCKIVQKSGFKLSSLREPESSATALHVALLYNHEHMFDFLLSVKESDLILAKYENEEYHNQTGLHVAVANGNAAIVEKLLEALEVHEQQELINTVANGKYFKWQHPHGQLCLSAAAWAGSGEILQKLVVHGGNLALKNLTGDTLMHSLVLQSSQYPSRNDYESLFMSVWEAVGTWADQMVYATTNTQQRALEQKQMQINLFKELLSIRNNDGYTPLALAATTNSLLFFYMINLEKIYKIPQNKLGSITWVTYDVTDITSFAYNTYNKFSVLHILAHNSQRLARHANLDNSQEEDYLEMEPIKALVTCKWKVYRLMYIGWLIIHFSFMVVFTAATAETNSYPQRPNGTLEEHKLPKIKYGYVSFTILPTLYIILEILDLFGNKPYRIQFMAGQNYVIRLVKCVKSEWTITGNGPYRLVNIGFSFFLIQWFFQYVSRDPNQDIALAMALLLGWIYVLFFTRGCRVTCRFSIMIQKMFFRDLIYFLTVYGIVLIAFSFGMNSLFTYKGEADITISNVFYDMMNVVTDLDRKQTIDDARHKLFAKLLLIFYAIVAVILLMNMLIAMMNTSYETVRVTRCNLWKQQQLSIMLLIERRFFWWKWLCSHSEKDLWRRESNEELRSYLDVTVLHTSSYKCL